MYFYIIHISYITFYIYSILNSTCYTNTNTYILLVVTNTYTELLRFRLSPPECVLGVFHLVGGVCSSMPTHAFYGLVAACLLLLRRVSLSRPHAGVMCGTGDITIQLYAN